MSQIPPLVTTEWLAEHLDDENLKILDATVRTAQQETSIQAPTGGPEGYEQAHIPGAQFADLASDLSDVESGLDCTLPGEQQFARAMGRLGVANDSSVVVYSAGYTGWATRLWWLLKTFGHEPVAVLDGGLAKWLREQRPLASGIEPVVEQTFTAKLNIDAVATRETVHAAVTEGFASSYVVDSLPAAYFRGVAGDTYGYGRLGHITGAINIPADELIDPEAGVFLPPERLREKFSSVMNESDRKVIAYCGAGIAATQNAFALNLLGRRNVAVYDASLQEWTKDQSLPMSLG